MFLTCYGFRLLSLKLPNPKFYSACILTHWKRPWCWEGLKAGGDGNHRGWDGWMASPTQWTWVWVDSGSWWWTGRPGVLQSMGLQRVRHDWATELNWYRFRNKEVNQWNKTESTEMKVIKYICNKCEKRMGYSSMELGREYQLIGEKM